MTVTVLASLFILLVVVVAAIGFTAIIKQGKSPQDQNTERCSLCRREYPKTQLVERQVGDYRLLYFCAPCINSLQAELVSKN